MRIVLAALLCLAVTAQEQKPRPARPPDSTALSAATAIKDPKQKVAALEKYLQDFPTAGGVSIARREIVRSLAEVKPKAAVRRVELMAKDLPPQDASSLHRQLATELINAKKLPKIAQNEAKAALELLVFDSFAAEERQRAAKNKRNAPTEAALRNRFRIERSLANETLGLAFQLRKKPAEATACFEAALQDNVSLATAAKALAEIQLQAGNKNKALDYYAHAMLAKPSPESRKNFESAWLATHGTAQGQREFLDARYKSLFPSPFHAERYQKSPARSQRVVLSEVYTGAGCPPCVAVDLAFDGVLERYGRGEVAVLMYHEHIPRPDPMTNRDTVSRWKWMEGKGVPTYVIDGKVSSGGGGREAASEMHLRITQVLEKQLEAAPLAQVHLRASNDGRAVKAEAKVSGIARSSPDLALQVALVEKEIRYSGENGVRFHPMVVRSLASFPLKDVTETTQTHTFELEAVASTLKQHLDEFEKHDERHNKDGKFRFMERPETLDATDLAVVAFVQDTKTKEVLQAVYTDTPRN